MVDKQHMMKQNIRITAPKHRTNIGKQAIIISERTVLLNLYGSN